MLPRTSPDSLARDSDARVRCREIALLLCCARTLFSEEHARELSSLASGTVNWSEVLELAQLHGVLPLVHRNLGRDANTPNTVRRRLDRAAHQNARRNLFLIARLLDIITLLERHGIAAMPYKGPEMALRVYGDPSLRQSTDLDLFVKRVDVPSA